MATMLRRADACETCEWQFERGPGHWVGGSELCMMATFWITCVVFILVHRYVPLSVVTMILAAATTVASTFLVYGRSRAIFVAIDFAVDPVADTGDDDDDDFGSDRVRLPGPGPSRSAGAPLTS